MPTQASARSLYNGLSGNDVVKLQETLISQGFLAPGYATGYFSSLTEKAVKDFQCTRGIICSGSSSNGYGVYGPATQAALGSVSVVISYPKNPATLDGKMTPPATGDFEISGWIPYWRSATGTRDVSPNLSKLTSVMPFGYTMKNDGTLADTAELTKKPWTSFIKSAKKKGVLIVPTVMWGNGDTIHKILSNAEKSNALQNEIVKAVKENNFDGIDIDFEAKKHETINYFSDFLKGLDSKMGDKLIYCTIEARMPLEHRYLPGANIPADATDYANDYVSMNKYCDRIEMMAYDQGVIDLKLSGVRKAPYAPVSDRDWVEAMIRLAAQTISRDKLILGIPTYGYEYKVTPLENGKFHYKNLWAFNPDYALEIAEKLDITPERTSANEIGFIYDESVLEEIKEAEEKNKSRKTIKSLQKKATDVSMDEPFNYMTWSDAEAIKDKVDLAHDLGLRGVAIFKFDGGEDQEMWDVLE